jgi:hypothetical protein
MTNRDYFKFLLFLIGIGFIMGLVFGIVEEFMEYPLDIIVGYIIVPIIIAWLIYKSNVFKKAGFHKAEERLFQPYFGISLREKMRIIISIVTLGSIPVFATYLALPDIDYPWYQDGVIFTALFVYIVTILGYGSILFETSRKIYNTYLAPIVVLAMVPVLFVMFRLDLIYESGNLPWIAYFGSFGLVSLGSIQLLIAARSIADSKARSDAELEFAGEVQKKFLQDLFLETDRYQVFGLSKAAKNLGGDFFLIRELEDKRIVAAAGDVSGHSFGAGLIMVMLKTALDSMIMYKKSFQQTLVSLNEKLLEQTDKSMFCTLGAVELPLDEEKVTLWNAGHMPLLHYINKEDKISQVRTDGLALGVTPKAGYNSTDVNVSPGDYLILYSDGLVEIRDEKNKIRDPGFFPGLVMDSIREAENVPEISGLILEKVMELDQSESPEDDLTLVIIRVL